MASLLRSCRKGYRIDTEADDDSAYEFTTSKSGTRLFERNSKSKIKTPRGTSKYRKIRPILSFKQHAESLACFCKPSQNDWDIPEYRNTANMSAWSEILEFTSDEDTFGRLSTVDDESKPNSTSTSSDDLLDEQKQDEASSIESNVQQRPKRIDILNPSSNVAIDGFAIRSTVRMEDFKAIDPSLLWIPMDIGISILGNSKSREIKTHTSNTASGVQKIVRDSCYRHFLFHFQPNQDTGTSDVSTSSDIAAAYRLVREQLCSGNIEGAIAVFKVVLLKARQSPGCEAVPIQISRQLALLNMTVGRTKAAHRFSTDAIRQAPSISGVDNQVRVSIAIEALIEHGLINFSESKAARAVKAWREALQMALSVYGYQHSVVARILSLLGIYHLESGNIAGSLSVLEESIEVQQRTLAKDSPGVKHERNIFLLATFMGNLAACFERTDQRDRALSLLEEAQGLLQSLATDTTDMEQVLMEHTDRVFCEKLQQDKLVSSTLDSEVMSYNIGNSTVQSTDLSSLFSENGNDLLEGSFQAHQAKHDIPRKEYNRVLHMFGNCDGIPARRLDTKLLTMRPSDCNDYLLLGDLTLPLTTGDCVRNTVKSWYGKYLPTRGVESHVFLERASSEHTTKTGHHQGKECVLPGFSDKEILNHADLRLSEIHLQVLRFLEAFQVQDAIRLLHQTKKSHIIKYGENHHLVGTACHNIGMVHLLACEYDQAVQSFKQAVTIRRKALGENHPDVQISRLRVALIQLSTGNAFRAKETLCEILEILVGILGDSHPVIALMHNNIGVASFFMGDKEGAIQQFETTYEYQRRLVDYHSIGSSGPENEAISYAIGVTLCNTAFVHFHNGKPLVALEYYEEASRLMPNTKEGVERVAEIVSNLDCIMENGSRNGKGDMTHFLEKGNKIWDVLSSRLNSLDVFQGAASQCHMFLPFDAESHHGGVVES